MLQSTRLVFATALQPPQPPLADVSLRSTPNWLGAGLFGLLATLYGVAGWMMPALLARPMERSIGTALGLAFAAIALGFLLVRREVVAFPDQRILRVRTGVGALQRERFINFQQVQAVRLMVYDDNSGRIRQARIAVLCRDRALRCPVVRYPHQHAVSLALAMGVRLMRVYAGGSLLDRQARNLN